MRSDHRGLRLERTDSDRCFALVSSRRSTGGMHAFYCYVKSKGHAIGPFYQSAIAFSQNKVQEGSKRWTVEVKLLLSDTLSWPDQAAIAGPVQCSASSLVSTPAAGISSLYQPYVIYCSRHGDINEPDQYSSAPMPSHSLYLKTCKRIYSLG